MHTLRYFRFSVPFGQPERGHSRKTRLSLPSSIVCFPQKVFPVLSMRWKINWIDFIRGTILLSLTGPGCAGNFFLFASHVYVFVMGPKKKPTDLLLVHLAFTNTMTLCARGIFDITAAFHVSNFLDSASCKTVFYLGRVARGLSMCTTCLLSVVQALTISPRTSSWRKLKPRTAWQVLPSLLLFWILNSLISSNLLSYITAAQSTNGSGITPSGSHPYCHMLPSGLTVRWLFLTLMALRDIISQSLMGWSSGYMAFRLCKHRQSVLHLRSSTSQRNSSPETRATRSALLLMACFLLFYWADFIFSFCIGSFLTNDRTVLNIKLFLTLGYASLSPFVLISRASHQPPRRSAR
uniref:Vomeronasal type-1 receptor n=1 Tax=Panthera leo TaxID=9689 RepID=A0A0A0Y1E1_PANLE|nr:vomeronasal receptor type I [Panthera leo]